MKRRQVTPQSRNMQHERNNVTWPEITKTRKNQDTDSKKFPSTTSYVVVLKIKSSNQNFTYVP